MCGRKEGVMERIAGRVEEGGERERKRGGDVEQRNEALG